MLDCTPGPAPVGLGRGGVGPYFRGCSAGCLQNARHSAHRNEAPMTKPTDAKNTLYCSFCGKSQHEVQADRGSDRVHL